MTEYCYLLMKNDFLGNQRIIGVYRNFDSAMYYCEKQCEMMKDRSRDDLQIERLTENMYCLKKKRNEELDVLYTFHIIKKQLIG